MDSQQIAPGYERPPSALGAWIRRNPVALKELRGRMRGARAFVVLTLYVALMGGFATALYLIYTLQSQVTAATSGGTIGKLIFGGLVAIELFLVCFIAPAFTSGAITGERERRTFHILRTTLLPARRLITGKLVAALAYVVLLLLVAVPLQSLAFLMGGVTLPEVLLSIELLLVTAVGYGVAGIFFSTLTSRTLGASVLTYVVVLLVTLALPMAGLTFLGFGSALLSSMNNPVTEAVLIYGLGLLGCTNPIATAVLTEIVLLEKGTVFFFTVSLSNGTQIPLVSPWLVFTLLYAALSLALVLWSVRRIRQIEV